MGRPHEIPTGADARSRSGAFVFAVLLACALLPAGAEAHTARTVSTQGWCQFVTPDFTVVSQMDPSDTSEWAVRLNDFLHAMRGRIPGNPRVLGPFTVVLFEKRSDFWDSTPILKSGETLQNLGAFSRSGGWGAIVATSDTGSSEISQRLVFGGGVDWLLSADHRRRPRALSTGLSEVYGAYAIEGRREIFGRPPRDFTSFLQRAVNHPMASAGRFLKIEELLAVRDLDPVAQAHGTTMFHVESWGFAHFLIFSKDMEKEHAMEKLLNAFAHKATPHEAVRAAFGDQADTIDSLFFNYIRGGDFYESEQPLQTLPLEGSPVPAPPALVAATLAQLEASVNNLDVAGSYATQAVRLAPDDARSQDALALVDFTARRHPEAAADCRNAIRLGTRNGWTWFMASVEAGQTMGNPEPGSGNRLSPDGAREAVNDAEKAILCCRGIEAAYNRVANLIPIVDHVTEDDGKFLMLGRTLFPNSGSIEIGHAQWARWVGDQALAVRILGDVQARSAEVSPAEVARARSLEREWAGPSSP